MRAAVILFPGTNCENETKLALESAGIPADIVRWNRPGELGKYDGYVLPGGFSYEDRVRAGVISAQDPVMKVIKEEAGKGKPVLGICNGAQVLIESGIVPGFSQEVQMALAPNINPAAKGYYCTWVRVRSFSDKCIFTRGLKEEVLPIPIAHAEGRFTAEKKTLDRLLESGQAVFRYCNQRGEPTEDSNPNGSGHNIAGVCNPEGNVLAMMPHPERASWNRQLPGFEGRSQQEMNSPAPCRKIFEAMKKYMEERKCR